MITEAVMVVAGITIADTILRITLSPSRAASEGDGDSDSDGDGGTSWFCCWLVAQRLNENGSANDT
jgi:hypothetical protein